jgi:hypothetical protein
MNTATFSIKETLITGWRIFQDHYLVLIGLVLVRFLLGLLGEIGERTDDGVIIAFLNILLIVPSILLSLISFIVTLKLVDGHAISWKNVLPTFRHVLSLVGSILLIIFASVVLGVFIAIALFALHFFAPMEVMIAFTALVVVAAMIVFATTFSFYPFLIVDKDKGPVEALKGSMHITQGKRTRIFLWLLSIAGINLLGVLALGIGLLISIPVSMVAGAVLYRALSHSHS